MNNNRNVIIDFNTAFDKGNSEGIARFISDDFEWHLLGDSIIKGKANVLKFFAEHPDMKIITVSKDYIIVDGDKASVAGEVQCTDKSGQVYDMYYCDVYELANGLITKMISYTVNKKKT
ncbi:nuclear transport factor 2 family protein [Mucilaginibacter flavus]|uniref:nuclear transport factor 2 family protein n=1 Tax=Mucilaginibacter flavus TaxID=931504 RepID=UPI0025B3BEA7|nr:nuclear transport factor 2 family protein [Mucilaginibacter flavus]MDN3581793.1 nuclear transport factor 2 family protein [Mucilaginibacter flavus]